MSELTTSILPDLLSVEGLQTVGMPSPVNLQVQSGQVWMISGPSGTGKSQTLKALADLIPHQGQISFQGQSMQSVCPEKWRSQIMYFAAETAWWLDSVIEHFDTPPDEHLLHAIGLQASILQKDPDECSSGEKQRLALLRGLSRSPTILLLDEITANLDTEASIKVERLLQNYLKQRFLDSSPPRAIIWVSHDVAQRQRMAPSEQQLIFKGDTPPAEKVEL